MIARRVKHLVIPKFKDTSMPQPLNKIPGTVRLAKLLTHLNASPKLTLNGLKKLKLSFAMENDHFGTRSVCLEALIKKK